MVDWTQVVRKANFKNRRDQLHDGKFCKLEPCERNVPIKPKRCDLLRRK